RLEISFPPLRTRFVSPPLTACFFVNPEGSLPKPSISVSPGGVIPVGGNVTIRCRHQRLDLSFLLYKDEDGNYLTYTDPAGSEAEFPITSARREHGGSYTCRYHDKSGIYSKHSDPVQIIVAGEGPAHPTGVTAPGAEVTIQCQGQRRDVRFFLHKAGDLNPQRNMDPAGDGAEFRIPTVGRQHGGSYSCSYRPQSEPFVSSQPSDPVELVVGSYPKPSISVSPGGVIPMGGNVIIRCRHQRLGLRFHLYKAGDGNYLTYTDPAGSEAEFPLTSVRWEHGGSYTCRYTYRAGGVAYSEPSDPVQIIVAGEGPIPASRLQAPHPAGPLGASASPRPSREDTQAEMGEEGDRVTGGSPAGGSSSPCRLRGARDQPVSCSVGGRSDAENEAGATHGHMRIPRTREPQLGVLGLGAQLAGSGFWVRGALGSGRESLPRGPWICLWLGEAGAGWVSGSGSHSLSPVRRFQVTQTLHLSEPHWGHCPKSRRYHPVSGAAPGREVLPAQGWRPEPAATHGPCWGWGRVPHPHRGPAARRELQLQLPAPIRALHLLAAQRPHAAGGSR
uniref:Ig-like domain-containing protein n=1 Tax=Terrapene triunguis TaxID=2587831 RepID=A0A674JTW5_9SAUR